MNNNTLISDQATQAPAESQPSSTDKPPRTQPIPPPSEPRQYRAIGLVQGKYHPSEEQPTKGTLITPDGTEIDAVLLGRVISLIKNHLSLEEEHLWVVYPRTRQDEEQLHVQITGVWEPDLLHPEHNETEPFDAIAQRHSQDGYFSVRGEVVYYSHEEEKVVIRIQQSPRKKAPPKKFTLQLKGLLPERPLKHFWELHVQREGSDLNIVEAHNFGYLKPARGRSSNKRPKGGVQRKGVGKRRFSGSERPTKPSKPSHVSERSV